MLKKYVKVSYNTKLEQCDFDFASVGAYVFAYRYL